MVAYCEPCRFWVTRFSVMLPLQLILWNRRDSNPRCSEAFVAPPSIKPCATYPLAFATLPLFQFGAFYKFTSLCSRIICWIMLRGYAQRVTLVLPSSSITSARSRGSFQPKCSNQSLLNIWNCFKKSLVDSHTSLFIFSTSMWACLIASFISFSSLLVIVSPPSTTLAAANKRFRSL